MCKKLVALLIIQMITVILLVTFKNDLSKFGSNSRFGSNDKIYIFHATWCGYCKASMDNFKKLVTKFPNRVELIDVDEDDPLKKKRVEELMIQYKVNSFPTIVTSSNVKYSGDRSFDSLVEFVNNN